MPASCLEDVPYDGRANILLQSDDPVTIQLKDDPTAPAALPVVAAEAWTLLSASDVEVSGFTLDGTFVMDRHQEIFPGNRKGKRPQRGEGNAYENYRRPPMEGSMQPADATAAIATTNSSESQELRSAAPGTLRAIQDYTLGTKTMLLVPVCPIDYSDTECFNAFNINLVQTTYGGSVVRYLGAVVDKANTCFKSASSGRFQLQPTIVAPVRLKGYTSTSCDTYTHLGWTSWFNDPTALDSMAYAQVEAELGIKRQNFAFGAIMLAKCEAIKWTGRGWIGIPGFVLNLAANDLDPSFVHEIGHNFGLGHAARLNQGTRGRAIWETEFIESYTAPPFGGLVEYGSDFTPMGRGRVPDAEYLLPAKILMEWIKESDTVQIPAGASCNPCGPFLLQPLDTGALISGRLVGIKIGTYLSDRYFFVEHRAPEPGNSFATAYSTSCRFDAADGGVMSRSVVVDKLVESKLVDAKLYPGETIELDSGPRDSPRPVRLEILPMVGGMLQVLVRSGPQAQTTTSPPPSRTPPLPAVLTRSPPPPTSLAPPPPPPPSPFPSPPPRSLLLPNPSLPPPSPRGSVSSSTAIIDSCTTQLERRAPDLPVITDPLQCSGWNFRHVGSLGNALACERGFYHMLLHFLLPEDVRAIDSVKLSFYVAQMSGKGAAMRLDGLGTRTSDIQSALALQSADDYFVGGADPTNPIRRVTQIESQLIDQGVGDGFTFEYASSAMTDYVRAEVAAGGGGKYLVLRLSSNNDYGCAETACYGCWWHRYSILGGTERLTINGSFLVTTMTRSGASAPTIDPAVLTARWVKELEELEKRDGEEGLERELADKRNNATTQTASRPWLNTFTGLGVILGAGLLALLTLSVVGGFLMCHYQSPVRRFGTRSELPYKITAGPSTANVRPSAAAA